MLENKLSFACNKFDDFKTQAGQSIEKMKNDFFEIILEIAAIKNDKYTQRELNLKVICALPASWHIYTALHPVDLTSTNCQQRSSSIYSLGMNTK